MTERLPDPESIDTYRLGERTLREWHDWLCTDQATGDPSGHIETPTSRYGTTAEDVAWWSVAAQCIYVESSGEPDNPEELATFMMGLAVNGHEDIEYMVIEHWQDIPTALQELLDVEGLR